MRSLLNLKDGSQKQCRQKREKQEHAAFRMEPCSKVYARKLSEAFVLQSEEKEWLHFFVHRLCADGFGTGFGIVCEDAGIREVSMQCRNH